MERNIKHVGVVVKNILAAVAVVYVRIDNGNFFNAVAAPQIFNHYGFNINGTKTADAMYNTHGVVSRRAYKRKRTLNFAAHYSVGRRHAPSGRGKMCRRNQFGY